jgi:dihydrodiol dehydrogenase / D-xylose 1-dehydrogenase (NADP)
MKNDKVIKWGILGPGVIARKFVGDIKHVMNAEVIAVGSRSIENAERFAQQFQIPRAYGSYEQLVRDADVDIIYVATPHPAHKDNVMSCLRAGKAVLCEKPFTINAQEAEEMVQYAKEAKLFLMEAMWTRFLPAVVKAKEWLSTERIGEVRMVKADFGFRIGWDPEHRLLNPELGGGSLLDAGIYPISFASMVFGEAPETIVSSSHIGETGVDEHFSALFTYSGGRTAALNGAVRLQMRNDAFIFGTEGYIHVPNFLMAKSADLFINGVLVDSFKYDGEETGYAFEAAEATRCLQEGLIESKIMPANETLQLMQTLDTIRQQWGLTYPSEQAK